MSQPIKRYRDLDVWRKAVSLTKVVYQLTAPFPAEERFGLVNQMRRAAVSIPSNIAEGHARGSTAEFLRFITIALGSIAELETQIIISAELNLLSSKQQEILLQQLDEIGKNASGTFSYT